MDCPNCQIKLIAANHKGLAFEYCPSCFGAWLDSRDLERFATGSPHTPTTVHIPAVGNRAPVKQRNTVTAIKQTKQDQPTQQPKKNVVEHKALETTS